MIHNNDSLMITIYQPKQLDAKRKQYSERTLLDQGKSRLPQLSLMDEDLDKFMLVDNLTFSLMDLFVDHHDFTFKDNVDYLFTSDKNALNFSYLFSYFSCKPEDFEKSEES